MDTGTLTDRVFKALRERILQGTYAPGQRLNLAELSRDLQVSNTPIREAMARLGRAGLVEVIPYSGVRIRRLSPEQVADIYDVRIALEELAVRLIVHRRDADTLQGMAAAIEAQARALQADDRQGRVDADRAFHDALVQASGNSVLIEMLPTLSDRTRLLLELAMSGLGPTPKEPNRRGLHGHQRILDALRKGDHESAVQALRDELTSGRERLLQRMVEPLMPPPSTDHTLVP